MTLLRALVAVVAVLVAAVAILQLEAQRAGLQITALEVEGGTPATLYLDPIADPAPVVVIAHGFAGSRQLMEPFALTLARAGYVVASFDFMGHGRNPRPMSGDVTTVAGTTQLLMDETARVARAALELPQADGRLALLGHSMASDVVVRQAQQTPRAEATVAVSLFSRAVTATEPANLLIVVGAWEARLRDEALRVLGLTEPGAGPGETLGDMTAGTARRAVFAPAVEHVGVLYSGTSLRETRAWLDAVFARPDSPAQPALRGGWIALLLLAVVALAWPLAGLLPRAEAAPPRLPPRRFAVAALAPALAAPLLLWPIDTRFLPVLVADYLALHLAVYGVLALLLCWRWGGLVRQFNLRALVMGLAVAAFGIGVFGMALDRYVASFMPHAGRLWIIAGLALGAVPAMLADAVLTEGGRAGLWRTLIVRGGFVASLALAVAIDFSGLFFLIIILPVIVLFLFLFGMIGGWVGRRSLQPVAGGLGLGLVLAWALGVTFPLFALG